MFGACCALCGALVIALPVSVVGTNFTLFYTYAKARLNLPPKAKQKQPFSKEIRALKVKISDDARNSSTYSCNSTARKHEKSNLGKSSLECVIEQRMDNTRTKDNSNFYGPRENGRLNSIDQNVQASTEADSNNDLAPSFRECNFDFLEVPVGKSLKKSFLSNSISRMFGAITQPSKQSQTQDIPHHLDIHATYPLYSRRGAVAPGSISSRSLSSTIYDSSNSNFLACIRQSLKSLRQRQEMSKKLGKNRKCTSNAELHLVCFHRCDKHPEKDVKCGEKTNCPTCTCSTHLSKPRMAKSCSELNDILQGNYRNSLNSINTSEASSGEISLKEEETPMERPSSVPFNDIEITINGCSDDSGNEEKTSLLNVNTTVGNGKFLKPWGNNNLPYT